MGVRLFRLRGGLLVGKRGSRVKNYAKLDLGATLSSMDGDNNNHGDCFNYGSVGGCDEHCPALNDC